MSLTKTDLIAIRPGVLGDKNFILATWLRGLRYGNDWFEAIDPDFYFKHYNAVLEHILTRPDAAIMVACLKDDPEVILGYSVFSGTRLDWVFVKKNWRAIGIAKSLIPPNIEVVSHLTRTGVSLLRKSPSVKFNPFSIT
jgi:hypothetical protein